MRALVWFRTDLRVRDNTALLEACADADTGVVGVFAVTPRQWKDRHDWGWPKADFTLRNARALSKELEKLNIALRVVVTPWFTELPDALLSVAREHGCDALYFNREYEVNELERDDLVSDRFDREDLDVKSFTDLAFEEPGEVLTKEGKWYSVFSPFRKAMYRKWSEEGAPEELGTPSKRAEMAGAPDDVPAALEGYGETEPYREDLWTAGEHAALTRLGKFCAERIGSYKAERDAPAVNGTSVISPYLAAGVVSPRQCLRAAVEANGGKFEKGKKGPDAWISELVWRDFYKHFVVGYPRVVKRRPFKTNTERIEWESNDEHLAAWQEGRTGYPIVDAAMRQLNQTGWMHNRLRMIVAMFLTKDLFLDWRLGEKYFASRLVDYDFGSNNGGWQWSASTGADAAPYFRIYNPSSQSERHDPKGAFIRKFVPELADAPDDAVHEPGAGGLFSVDYPAAIVDHAEARERALAAFKSLNESEGKPVREI